MSTLLETGYLRPFGFGILILTALLRASDAVPQDTPTVTGNWTATVGAQRTLRGRWIGQALPDDPNRAHGSWTLLNDSSKTVMTGTWSARKMPQGWQGTWSAHAVGGQAAGGTWKADLPSNPKGALQFMLDLSAKEEIAGTWRSGKLQGSWWLKGKSAASTP